MHGHNDTNTQNEHNNTDYYQESITRFHFFVLSLHRNFLTF